MIELATGLALTAGRVLLVASRYANHPEPLWTLPGGRRQSGELLVDTVERELFEETGLCARAGELAYLSESYDGAQGYLNATFLMLLPQGAGDDVRPRDGSDHTIAAAWVPVEELTERIAVAVVREPLLAYLRGELARRYAGFHEAGVTIEWPAGSA
jgi:8-oxo-dGTP diphosphatase